MERTGQTVVVPLTQNEQADIERTIASHTAILLPVAGSSPHGEPDLPASGTLVRVNDRPAILTAAHVVKWLKRDCFLELGLAVTEHLHWYSIPMRELRFLTIARPRRKWGPWGPDLGAILLPRERVAEIEARRRTFYNLDRHRGDLDVKLFEALPRGPITAPPFLVWAVAGAPEERQQIGRDVGRFHGMIGLTASAKSFRRLGYHYIDLMVARAPNTNPPRSFEGVSGGGLWLIPFAADGSAKPCWTGELHLSGVAFYQRRGALAVRCHGPVDLMSLAYPKLRRALR